MTLQNEIKGNLARLLATENLIVEHRADISTASFDVQRRVLQLPKWDLASNTVYDMLVGHEVGHALFTPNEDPSEFGAPMEFVNVIEDARIEKLIKRKYAGLPKIFNTAYRELSDDDFFGIEGEELDQLTLIDRINLHCKVGAYAMIPFAEDEVVFVKRTESAETFEEVLEIAKDVYGEQKRQKESLGKAEQGQEGSGTGSQDHSENSTSAEQETESSEGGEDGDQSDEGGFKISQQPSADNGDTTGGMGGQSYDDDEVRTQQAFDEQTESLSRKDYHGRPNQYVELPKKLDINKITVDWTEIHDWIDQRREAYIEDQREYIEKYYAGETSGFDQAKTEYQKFRKQSQKEVNYLVKEFEMKKSADSYARAATARTGVLDTAKLHTYKYNEDLFKKVTVLPDGKNHGLIFVLDWSGSMSHCIHSTVKQLLNLTSFCKKVQIPFEVYAFTNEWKIVNRIKNNQTDDSYSSGWYYGSRDYANAVEGELFVDPDEFNMLNLISSRSNARDYERQCLNVWYESFQYECRTFYRPTEGLQLSGTPLNEAIISLNYMIPQFKKDNDLQKVNVVILSDGDSTYAQFAKKVMNHLDEDEKLRVVSVGEYCVLRDRKTGRVYPQFLSSYVHVTNTLIKQVRDRFPEVNIIGIRLCKGGELSSFVSRYADSTKYDDVQQQWKKHKSAIIPDAVAYSALYALRLESLDEETEFEVASDASKGQITRAFKKMLKSKSTNKKVLSAFAEMVS